MTLTFQKLHMLEHSPVTAFFHDIQVLVAQLRSVGSSGIHSDEEGGREMRKSKTRKEEEEEEGAGREVRKSPELQ